MASDLPLDLPATASAWAASGAMALTGRAGGPALGPPERLVPGVLRLGERLRPVVDVDPLALLGERAARLDLTRGGDRSCGGGTRLLRAADGWVALALARPDDLELLPAWIQLDVGGGPVPVSDDVWALVARAVARRPAEEVVTAGAALGLAVAAVPAAPSADAGPGVVREVLGPGSARAVTGARVVDLSSLWAGPLCGSLLAGAGADVVKVESTARPDGARRGDPGFYDLLNAGKRSVALDLTSTEGRSWLRELVEAADVVIEASRPRALEQLGVDARALLAGGGPKVWVSITGHGRSGDAAQRVGFGDDAAAAGGLVVWDDDGPCFCADAVADPLSGLVATAEVLHALAADGATLIDVGMAPVAQSLAGPTMPIGAVAEVAAPRSREGVGRAAALGADTAAVLDELAAPS